ncbi:MAG: 30S ribosome-binding factor RbfA [Kordiimonadaceae bacterium]|jgi:ribosome-binding factor A|nr:30S ribosome-binding factor RbfA [Kordiimonadaceae bacterium]MBT6035480.1 30S ribosome-binding factor RbfA [Kordiimonadaceae bacterium]MBT6328919.1 30S ribosome-binding factor RbfA [Kordiimonadaceae bacterium]MBT7581653.1 30S ribosome-binding factor RbfA [Kordiimonadaceae bacterium]
MSKSRFDNNGEPSQRLLRVGENIRHALSEIISRGDIRDDDLENVPVTVTEVRCSPDLRNATIFAMPLGGVNEKEVIEALNRNTKFIRGQLSKMVSMKYLPALKFTSDHSFGEVDHIEELLNSSHVAQDLKKDD